MHQAPGGPAWGLGTSRTRESASTHLCTSPNSVWTVTPRFTRLCATCAEQSSSNLSAGLSISLAWQVAWEVAANGTTA